MRKLESALAWLERRLYLMVVLVGFMSLTINAALSLYGHMPQPEVHDEFSYLLAADTFAQGRLTNPAHPMWVHFESIHINQQPTYASMYPPGQGLMLALGQIITGYPIAGAWLSVAFGCAAITWMLFAWLPPRWALLAGMIATVHPLILQWSQNYWGGGAAMFGGALALGAFRRMIPVPRARAAMILGAGIGVLANTRLYEGFVLSLLLCVGLIIFMLGREGKGWRVMLRGMVLPLCAVLLPVAIWMGYYNFRVTGDIFLMPRVLNAATYMVAPLFLWEEAGPEPVYRHRAMRDFHVGWEMSDYLAQRSFTGIVSRGWEKSTRLAREYFRSWGLIVSLIALPWVLGQDRWMRMAMLILSLFVAASLMVYWLLAHYAAPVMGLVLAVALQSMRVLSGWRWGGKPMGHWLAAMAVALCFISGTVACAQLASKGLDAMSFSSLRAQIIARLTQAGGKHLIVVRYRPDHNVHLEWVYNAADIDRAPIVWAREMDDQQNLKLVNYFSDRHVWLFEAENLQMRLMR